ncbi:ABC transporter permease [Actinomyces sp. HMSC065F11]|uniref:ABC transporter permease n=1 Tax=Actinomyces sp. HMSC065F11 TaxID=1739395 RepID=UPI00050F6D4B|nr:ABC transporter permease [Actinomyces sp. HMSC065F11]KGF02036.1 ABC transporter permease [Actinomyces sp. S4-C9]
MLTFGAPLVFGLFLLLCWWLITIQEGTPSWMLPSPAEFATRLISSLSSTALWQALWVTLKEAALGSFFGALIALPMAYLIYRSQVFSAAVEPFLGATQAIPAIALAPLLVLWVGYGTSAIVALCTLMVFFPILVSTTVGLRHLDVEVMEAARLDGASGLTLLLYMEIPLALPSILAGLRNGFTLSVTGAVVGEMVMGGAGLGTVLTVQRNSLDTSGMFVTISLLCVMAMTVYSLIYTVERKSKLVNTSRR